MSLPAKEIKHTKGKSDEASINILVVDDNQDNVELLDALLSSRGYAILKAYNGEDALKIAEEARPHLIILDVMMPRMDGYEVCRRLKTNDKTRFIPVIILTALSDIDIEDKIKGIEAGADDFISKPFQKPELLARVRSLVRVKHLLEELEDARNVIFSFATALDFNDPYTHGHSQRVSELSVRLAGFLGLSQQEQNNIRDVGILHDIGKIATDKGVLHKPGALNGKEYEHVKQHPIVGERICAPLDFAKPLLPMIRSHHEKFNGAGYPDGLSGDDIPLGARIISIVDLYDALTSARPYRRGMSQNVALEVMKIEAEKGYWDKEILLSFVATLKEPPRCTA
ncbi:MAG: response regulator [Deltaproteobacteria bacterium]|nr:response regulator [Deltaproteobacteria bacterium]